MTTGEDTLEKVYVGHDRSPGSDCPMTTGEDTLEKVCVGRDRSPSSERPRANVMARYEWTCV